MVKKTAATLPPGPVPTTLLPADPAMRPSRFTSNLADMVWDGQPHDPARRPQEEIEADIAAIMAAGDARPQKRTANGRRLRGKTSDGG